MNGIIRFVAQGCSALAFLGGLLCVVAAVVAASTVFQEIAWGVFAIACFCVAILLMVSAGVTYLEELTHQRDKRDL